MGALRMGLEESELQPLVNLWRAANPKIVALWKDIENAAIRAVDEPGRTVKHNNISFAVENDYLFITLPSGRRLAYVKPRLKSGKFGNDALTYEGTDQNTKQWKRLDTYGGKLVENIVQATARDLLGEAMLKVHGANYNIVMHVHDEIVLEENDNPGNKYLEDICAIMSENPPWATGLPLGAEGYVTEYYKKD